MNILDLPRWLTRISILGFNSPLQLEVDQPLESQLAIEQFLLIMPIGKLGGLVPIVEERCNKESLKTCIPVAQTNEMIAPSQMPPTEFVVVSPLSSRLQASNVITPRRANCCDEGVSEDDNDENAGPHI